MYIWVIILSFLKREKKNSGHFECDECGDDLNEVGIGIYQHSETGNRKKYCKRCHRKRMNELGD